MGQSMSGSAIIAVEQLWRGATAGKRMIKGICSPPSARDRLGDWTLKDKHRALLSLASGTVVRRSRRAHTNLTWAGVVPSIPETRNSCSRSPIAKEGESFVMGIR